MNMSEYLEEVKELIIQMPPEELNEKLLASGIDTSNFRIFMDVPEKILLIQVLLEDIRGDWGWDNHSRSDLAESLCLDMIGLVKDIEVLAESIRGYQGFDGRYFRDAYPQGYEGMSKLHNIGKTYFDKSHEFKYLADKYLTHPEYRFEDYATKEEVL